MILFDEIEIKFTEVTHKILYEDALKRLYTDHHSQHKWVQQLNTPINWKTIW